MFGLGVPCGGLVIMCVNPCHPDIIIPKVTMGITTMVTMVVFLTMVIPCIPATGERPLLSEWKISPCIQLLFSIFHCRRLLCNHPDHDNSDHVAGSSDHEDVPDCSSSSCNPQDAHQVISHHQVFWTFFLLGGWRFICKIAIEATQAQENDRYKENSCLKRMTGTGGIHFSSFF